MKRALLVVALLGTSAFAHEGETQSGEHMNDDLAGKITARGITLPSVSTPLGNYAPAVTTSGKLLFLSGQIPITASGEFLMGKVGESVSVEEGYKRARLAGLRLLSVAQSELGSLDRIKRVVKITGFVNSGPEFKQHPKVVNGCSDLMVEVFGDAGKHARSSVGVGSLPENVSVEIEAIFEIE